MAPVAPVTGAFHRGPAPLTPRLRRRRHGEPQVGEPFERRLRGPPGGKRREDRQAARGGVARPEPLERGVGERRFRPVAHEFELDRGQGRRAARRREQHRDPARQRARHDRRERRRRRQVIGDEKHGAIFRARLHRGLDQPGGEAALVGAEARRGPAGAGRDAPVARGRVVHRVVEARRRDVARGTGEGLADLVQHLAVPGRAGEHRRQVLGPRAAERERLRADVHRELHQVAAAPPLGRRQDLGGRARHLAGS
jgi:hypothetical protein